MEKANITVAVTIKAPVEKVWTFFTEPLHIINWSHASDDWHTSKAENDLRVGGKFLSHMEAKDGSAGFDFVGVYNKVEHLKTIAYTLDDDRKVGISFNMRGNETIVTETFEAEQTYTVEQQKSGWQNILDNFKKYVESSPRFDILHFDIEINSSQDNVYKTMLDKKKYSEWTSVFNPDSHYIGSWDKGSKILFLGTDSDGELRGMVSMIKENIPGKFLSIQHNGIFQNGKEITCGPEIDEWAGILENYTFTLSNNKTLLSVDIDSSHEFKSYFIKTWPLALDKLKFICENN